MRPGDLTLPLPLPSFAFSGVWGAPGEVSQVTRVLRITKAPLPPPGCWNSRVFPLGSDPQSPIPPLAPRPGPRGERPLEELRWRTVLPKDLHAPLQNGLARSAGSTGADWTECFVAMTGTGKHQTHGRCISIGEPANQGIWSVFDVPREVLI